MSDLFAMSDPSADAKLAAARENSVDSLSEIAAPWYRGAGTGLGLGFMRGFAKVGDALGIALGGTAARAIDKSRELADTSEAAAQSSGDILSRILSGNPQSLAAGVPIRPDTLHTEAQDTTFGATEATAGNAVDFWTPRANEVGRVGQVLGGVGEVGSELVAGLGTPYAVVGTSTAEGGKELVDQGVDAGTAGAAAAIEGAASYAGLKVPIAGSTLLSRVGTGIAGNVALGSGSREAEKLLLESRGYDDQAQRFTTDLASVSTDALVGALFGATHHTLAPRIDPKLTPAQADALLTARNAKSFQEETAPGTPGTVTASVAHQSAMEATLEQLSAGKPVDVGDVVARHEGAQFTADGRVEASADLARMVDENVPEDVPRAAQPTLIERSPNLSEADRAIESRFADTIEHDVAGQVEAYKAIPETEGGNVINTDIVRELSPDYLADRSKAAAVHEPASFLTKEIYRRKLAEAKPGGEVIFAAGGAGSGKSSGLKLLGIKDQLVYDGTLSKFKGATHAIDQALASKQNARIVFTYRDVSDALRAALKRATDQETLHGAGRTVPLDAFEQGHRGARDVFEKLLEKYGQDDRVRFDVIDNTRGQGEARRVKFDDLPAVEYDGLREKLHAQVEAAHASGTISDAVRRGFSGPIESELGRLRTADRGQPESQRAEQGPDSVTPPPTGGIHDTPELASLRRLAAERPDALVYAGADADGHPIESTVAEQYAQIQRDYERELEDTKAYEAAVTCFMGHGA